MRVASPASNPFVGPRPFQSSDRLFGRATELHNLCDLLVAERIVLLHSPSGAGKTSLIHAGLMQRLREEEKFRVLPVMRVNLRHASPGGAATSNKYLRSAMEYLELGLPEAMRMPSAELEALTFREYLERRPHIQEDGPAGTAYELLIVDQFEEIVTLDPVDRDAKTEFFRQVGEALRNRNRWMLFAMREDHIAEIDDYCHLIPTALTTRFRLNLLQRTQAAEAILEPTKLAGRPFGEDVVRRLVEDLATVTVQGPSESRQQIGDFVEPVQLQVVCRRLWDRHVQKAVAVEDVSGTGAVNEALEGFYADAAQTAAKESGVPERRIREWIEAHLIVGGSLRGQIPREEGETRGLSNKAIDVLGSYHLLRGDRRRGIEWIEITHDRLLRPILENNGRWRVANLSMFHQQARLWVTQGRPEGMLLSGKALADAEAWADAHDKDLSATELEFLAACRAARERARELEEKNRLIAEKNSALEDANRTLEERNREVDAQRVTAQRRLWIFFATVAVTVILLLAIFNMQGKVQLTKVALVQEQNLSRIRQLVTAADGMPETQYAKALALALSANGLARDPAAEGSVRRATKVALIRALASVPPVALTLSGHRGSVRRVAFTPDGGMLASASFDGRIILWDTTTGKKLDELTGHPEGVYALAFSGDGRRMASCDAGGKIRLWSVEGRKVTPVGPDNLNDDSITRGAGHRGKVTTLSFSPDGSKLATGGWDNHVIVWDVADPTKPRIVARTKKGGRPQDRHSSVVYSVVFNPDGEQLVSGDWNGEVRVWRWNANGTEQQPVLLVMSTAAPVRFSNQAASAVYSLAFNLEGTRLAASGWEKTTSGEWRSRVTLWDFTSSPPAEVSDFDGIGGGSHAPVFGVAFASDGKALVSAGGLSKTARLWDFGSEKGGQGDFDLQFPERLYSVAFNPKNPDVYALGGMRTVMLVDRKRPPLPLTQFLSTAEGTPAPPPAKEKWERVAVARDGRLVAALRAGSLFLWKRQPGEGAFKASSTNVAEQAGIAAEALAVSGDSRFVAIGGRSNQRLRVAVWDVSNGTLLPQADLKEFDPSGQSVPRLGFNPKRSELVIAFGAAVGLYDVISGGPIKLVGDVRRLGEEKDNGVVSLAFSADGNLLATGATDSKMRVWKVTGGRGLEPTGAPIELPDGRPNALAFHPDGTTLAAGTDKSDILIFDVATRKLEQTLDPMHEVSIRDLMYGGKGNEVILISIDSDAKAYLWDTLGRIYNPMRQPLAAQQPALAALDGSGELLVTAARSRLLAWELRDEQLVRIACKVPPATLSGPDLARYSLSEEEANPCARRTK